MIPLRDHWPAALSKGYVCVKGVRYAGLASGYSLSAAGERYGPGGDEAPPLPR
jgi:hypothetical protein